MSIILFLIILLALIFVHEFGHFIVAKWTGCRVDEFAFGFPPRLFSKKVGETNYAVNALPLGGYVSIYGENGEENDKAKDDPRAFHNRSKISQLAVLSAGVLMNFIFAWLIFVFTSYGDVQVSLDDGEFNDRAVDRKVLVLGSYKDSPAERAGLVAGTTIIKIESGKAKIAPDDADKASSFIASHINESIKITYKKPNGQMEDTIITGVYGIDPDKKVLGVSIGTVGTINTGFVEAIKFGTERTSDITAFTFDGIKGLLVSIAHRENVIDSLSGPVGIAKMVGETENFGYKAVLNFTAVLSINLAIFNMLPVPALDGGRFIIVIFETVFRRRMKIKWMQFLNGTSFILLILLLIAVTIKDISN